MLKFLAWTFVIICLIGFALDRDRKLKDNPEAKPNIIGGFFEFLGTMTYLMLPFIFVFFLIRVLF